MSCEREQCRSARRKWHGIKQQKSVKSSLSLQPGIVEKLLGNMAHSDLC